MIYSLILEKHLYKQKNEIVSMKSKNTFSFILAVIVSIFVISIKIPNAVSHAPETIILSYDESTDKLDMYMTHPVEDPATHYINLVEIYVNAILIDTYPYTSQPDDEAITYQYDLVAEDGDVILVKASCSETGFNTKEMTVGELPNEPSEPGSIPLGIIPIMAFSILGIIVLMVSKRKISDIK